MASGEGRRFGGNKLLASFQGRPLICRTLTATDAGLFFRRIVVTRYREVADICRGAGVEAVLHDLPYRNDTIRIGLENLGEQLPDGCMFCPCDQPLLSKDTVEALARAFLAQPEHIYRLCWQDTPGSPQIFPKKYFSDLKNLPRGQGGSYVTKAHAAQTRRIQAASAWELQDVDTADDLKLLENSCTAP